jgi:hypothetical protein
MGIARGVFTHFTQQGLREGVAAMRCADFCPTPGRPRKAVMSAAITDSDMGLSKNANSVVEIS